MAAVGTISYQLGLQTQQAYQQLNRLHSRANSIFSNINLSVNSKGVALFEKSLDQATSRVLAFTSATTLIRQSLNVFQRLTSDAIQVQKAITGIQAILGSTGADLAKVQSSLFSISNKVGVSFFDAAAAAQEFSRAGLSLEQTLRATSAALGVVRTSGGNTQEVIQGLIATINAFDSSNLGFDEVADKLSALDAAFSTSASGLIQAFSRVASFAAEAGVNIDQLGGLIATVKQISGRSEAQIGNSIKSIFVNLQNDKVQGIIESVGVATREAGGEFRNSIDVLRDLAGAYDNLTDAQRGFLTQKIAGKFQANAFQSIIQGFQSGTFDRSVGISEGADNDIAKRLEILNKTTATTIQKIQNSITELGSTLGDSVGRNFVEGFLRYAGVALDGVKKVFEAQNPLGAGISAGLTAALTGPGIALGATLLISLFRKIGSGVLSATQVLLKQSGVIATQNQALTKQAQIQQQINTILQQRTHFTGANGTQIPIQAPAGRLTKPTRPNFASISAQAGFQGLNPTPIVAQAKQTYVQSVAAYRKQEAARRKITERNTILARSQIAQEAKAENRRQSVQQGLLGAAFLVPALTSAVATGIQDASKRRQVDAVGQGAATALIGASLFGSKGAVIGTLLGGFQALSVIVKELYGNLDDVNTKVNEQINQNNKERQAGDLLVQAQTAYNEALKSGKINLINRAEKDLQTAMTSLSPSRIGLLSAGTNIEKLTNINDQLNRDTDRKNSAEAALSAATKVTTENYAGFFKGIGGQFSKTMASAVDLTPLSKTIVDALDVGTIDSESIDRTLRDFANTGRSGSAQSFVKDLVKDFDSVGQAIDIVSKEFKNGAEETSIAILSEIQARQRYTKILDVERQKVINQTGFDKVFRTQIDSIFSGANFREKISELNLENSFKDFKLEGGGLGGIAGIKSQSAEELLSIQGDFVENIRKAKDDFRKELSAAITDNIEGEENRGKVVGALESILEKGFDPNTVSKALSDLIGADNTKRIFIGLKPALTDFNNSVKLSSTAMESAAARIAEAERRMVQQAQVNLKFGNPLEDQSELIKKLMSGQDDIANARRLNREPTTDSSVEASKRILAALKAQGETGILVGSDQDRKDATSAAIGQLVNSRRIELDTGFITAALTKLQKPDSKSPSFGFGSGPFSASGYQKFLNEQIKFGNFKAIDENPVTQSVKSAAANGDTRAAELVQAIENARQRFLETGGATDELTKQFLDQNNLWTQIRDYQKTTADNTTALVNSFSTLVANSQKKNDLSPAAVASIFDNNARLRDATNQLGTKQRILTDVQEDRSATARAKFNTNIKGYAENTGLASMLYTEPQVKRYKELDIMDRFLNKEKDDSAFRGGSLSKDEITDVKRLFNEALKSGLSASDLEGNVLREFGRERGREIIDGGVLDPYKSTRPDQKSTSEINLLREIQELKADLERLKANSGITNPEQTGQNTSKNIDDLTQSVALLAQGVNINLNSQIGVDLTGAPTQTIQSKLETDIRNVVASVFKEAMGKPPVLAPIA